MTLRVPRHWSFPRLGTGWHAGMPCAAHQPGGHRRMVHREAWHAVAAMRGGRELLVGDSLWMAFGEGEGPAGRKPEAQQG